MFALANETDHYHGARERVSVEAAGHDAKFGMVDAATMAIAERLKIEVILTLDHRDFGI